MHAWQQSRRECHLLSYVRRCTSGGEPRPGRLSRWDSHPQPLPVLLLWRLNQFLRHPGSQNSPKAQTWLSKESGSTKHTFWHVNGGEHFLKVWELNTAGVYIYRKLLQNSFLWFSEAGETAEQRLRSFVQPWFWQSHKRRVKRQEACFWVPWTELKGFPQISVLNNQLGCLTFHPYYTQF